KLARDESELDPVADRAAEAGEQRAGSNRAHDPVWELPAELLDRLECQRLRPLRVVGTEVHVDERPGPALAQLGAEPVDVVVRAADGDQPRAVHGRREQL